MRTFKASKTFRGNLTNAELHHMERHPSEAAMKYAQQVPYHLQFMREQKAKQAQKEAEQKEGVEHE